MEPFPSKTKCTRKSPLFGPRGSLIFHDVGEISRSSDNDDALKPGAVGLHATISANCGQARDEHPSIESIRAQDDRKMLHDVTVLATTDDIPRRAFSFWDSVFASPSQQLTSAIDTSKVGGEKIKAFRAVRWLSFIIAFFFLLFSFD